MKWTAILSGGLLVGLAEALALTTLAGHSINPGLISPYTIVLWILYGVFAFSASRIGEKPKPKKIDATTAAIRELDRRLVGKNRWNSPEEEE
jgi:hypothetical protein